MADEPRRSGRAGKGQNAKLQDEEKPTTAKGKKGKKNAKSVEVEEEEEDVEDLIRCICGDQEGIPGIKPNPAMICCDNCNAWQHNLCMGLSEDDEEVPEKYYCEQCRPQDHPTIIAALKKGEKIWEERQQDFINAKKSGKKKGRKSKGGRTSNARDVVEPASTADTEPAPEPEAEPYPAPMQPPPAPAAVASLPQEISQSSAAAAEESSKKRRQSAAKITDDSDHKRRKSSVAVPEPTGDLTADRHKLVTSLQNHFTPLIKERVSDGVFKLPGQSNVDGFSIQLSATIEQALNNGLSGAREKADKARMIMFNTKKNETLLLGILNRNITADSLVDMSSEEMATEELQQERSVMKEEADKQAMLLHDEGPRMRKTHKGDEIIGGDGQQDPSLNLATNLPNRGALADGSIQSPSAMSPTSATPGSALNGHASLGRKTSDNFDIKNVWSQVKSPDTPQGTFPNNALRQKSISRPKTQQTPTQGPGEDADIDRLLDDENEWIDGSYVNDADVQWSGSIYMKKAPGTLKSLGTAKHFGGFEMNNTTPWKKLLRTRLEISGRLLSGKADEYVIAHKKSQRKEVSVLRFEPSCNHTPEDLESVASYFLQNDRWGVINGNKDPNVQDLYFVPVKGAQGKPKFFEELGNVAYTPSEEFQYFLVAIVLVHNSPPPQGFGEQTPIPQPQGTPQLPTDPSFNNHRNGHSIPQMDGAGSNMASPTPYQQQPLTPNADPAYHPSPLAISILGPYINEIVAKQMVVLPNVTEQHLLNLRDAFEKDERCRSDMAYLMQWLQARGAQQD